LLLRYDGSFDLASAVFVDESRMFYVGASSLARASNAHRCDEFLDTTVRHLADLDRQLAGGLVARTRGM
jgi:hypothetical protein